MKRHLRIGLLGCIIHLLGIGLTLPAAADVECLSCPPIVDIDSKLYDDARTFGSVLVTVRVAITGKWLPEGYLAEADVEAQRGDIKKAQGAFLSRHTVELITRIPSAPYLIVRLNEATLTSVAHDTAVVSVQGDFSLTPSLDHSLMTLGAPNSLGGFGSQQARGSAGRIAIIDTGVRASHSFFGGAVDLTNAWCFSAADNAKGITAACPLLDAQGNPVLDAQGNPIENQVSVGGPNSAVPCAFHDDCRHGTHVAGIAAGRSGSFQSATFTGVAPNSVILPIRAASNGTASTANPRIDVPIQASALTAALAHLYENRTTLDLAAVNISSNYRGSSSPSLCPPPPDPPSGDPQCATQTQISNLRSVGIPVIVSSGNESLAAAVDYPAWLSGVIAVGSTARDGNNNDLPNVAPSSNLRLCNDSGTPCAFLLAPGDAILSSVPPGTYARFSGTSQSAPHVAGAFSVMKGVRGSGVASSAWIADAYRVLFNTALPITSYDNTAPYMRPRLNRSVDAFAPLASPARSGTADTPVTITGTGFKFSGDPNPVVRFGGIIAPITAASETSISVTAPGQNPGTTTVDVKVTAFGYERGAGTFTYGTVLTQTSVEIESVSPTQSIPNQVVTFTVLVRPSSGTVVPTGTVRLKNGANTIDTKQLANGRAALSYAFPAAGTFYMTAEYVGDSLFSGNTSIALPYSVSSVGVFTTTTLTTSQGNASVGALVRLTATVTPISGPPVNVGTVKFFADGRLLPNAQGGQEQAVSNGIAILDHSFQQGAIGDRRLVAEYVRAGDFLASDSNATPITQTITAPCLNETLTLCVMAGNRFQMTVNWTNPYDGGTTGVGTAGRIPGGRGGSFWFFDSANIELVMKVHDGRSVNGRWWVFIGAMSTVEYTVTVTDKATGNVKLYHNPPRILGGWADVTAFADDPAQPFQPTVEIPDLGPAAEVLGAPGGERTLSALAGMTLPREKAMEATGGCATSGTTLCLTGQRFRVGTTWTNPYDGGTSGPGVAGQLSDTTGYFWFFEPNNPELVLKVLDGRSVNGKFWVFWAALSDVEISIPITDTQTGAVKTYTNPPRERISQIDMNAF